MSRIYLTAGFCGFLSRPCAGSRAALDRWRFTLLFDVLFNVLFTVLFTVLFRVSFGAFFVLVRVVIDARKAVNWEKA